MPDISDVVRTMRLHISMVLRILLALSSATRVVPAQSPPVRPSQDASAGLSIPPRSWVVDVAANEIRALQHQGSYLRYRMHTVDERGDRVRDVIESRDGTVARLLLINGRPLTAEEDKEERDRLANMLASPTAFAKHIRNEASEKKTAEDLIRLMPDAMVYTYVAGQPQIAPTGTRPQIVIDFVPNPNWSAPSTTAEALTGLRGRVWIDPETRQLLRIEGSIFRAVNFGWGMLARIYPGGTLALEQTSVGRDRWIFTHFAEDLTAKALMVKTLRIHTTAEASSFQLLESGMSYRDAIQLLLESPLPRHQGGGSTR